MPETSSVEIRLLAQQGAAYLVEMTLAATQQVFPGQVAADLATRTPAGDSRADGQALFDALFASADLMRAWGAAHGKSKQVRVQLRIDAPELHALTWELLRDDQDLLAADMTTTDARALPATAQEDLRRRPVKAVRDGMTQTEAAQVFGVARPTVTKWVAQYEAGGTHALKAKRRGRPRGRNWPPTRRRSPCASSPTAAPTSSGSPSRSGPGKRSSNSWPSGSASRSRWTVGRSLKRWGFTPQKPLRRAFEQDPAAIRRWLAAEYPAIQAAAKQAKATIHWGDEMGLRSDHQTVTSYGRKGQTPIIPGTGQRFRCNVLSTVTNRGQLAFMVFKEGFCVAVFLRFLRRLLRHSRTPIFLIVDRHPVHRAKAVQTWLADRPTHLRLFFLPAYSPELNPDEYLNQDVKSNALGRQRPRHQAALLGTLRASRSRQRRPAHIRSYFRAEPVQYAA